MSVVQPIAKFTGFLGIQDDCDALATKTPKLRQAMNVDVDDQGKIASLRDGFGAAFVAGDYRCLWPQRPTPSGLTLGVTGSTLKIINSGGTTTTVCTDLDPDLDVDFCEVNGRVYYSNGQVYRFIENRVDGVFPTITASSGSAMPAGSILEYYEERMYSIVGNKAFYSAPWDFGRCISRKDFLQFPGLITMFRAVKDGIFCSYSDRTVFLNGRRPMEFSMVPVADYAAIPRTSVKFDASLVSSNTPLQGDAVYWHSEKGPCIGYQGGMMLNFALTKVVPDTGETGASIVRKNSKGFYQALTVLQN